MRKYNSVPGWKHIGNMRRAHWSILTLDDLPKTDRNYSELFAQLKTRYQADKKSDAAIKKEIIIHGK